MWGNPQCTIFWHGSRQRVGGHSADEVLTQSTRGRRRGATRTIVKHNAQMTVHRAMHRAHRALRFPLWQKWQGIRVTPKDVLVQTLCCQLCLLSPRIEYCRSFGWRQIPESVQQSRRGGGGGVRVWQDPPRPTPSHTGGEGGLEGEIPARLSRVTVLLVLSTSKRGCNSCALSPSSKNPATQCSACQHRLNMDPATPRTVQVRTIGQLASPPHVFLSRSTVH